MDLALGKHGHVFDLRLAQMRAVGRDDDHLRLLLAKRLDRCLVTQDSLSRLHDQLQSAVHRVLLLLLRSQRKIRKTCEIRVGTNESSALDDSICQTAHDEVQYSTRSRENGRLRYHTTQYNPLHGIYCTWFGFYRSSCLLDVDDYHLGSAKDMPPPESQTYCFFRHHGCELGLTFSTFFAAAPERM
jgi:hypothetical protein